MAAARPAASSSALRASRTSRNIARRQPAVREAARGRRSDVRPLPCPPSAPSIHAAQATTRASRPGRPTTCTPSGSPDGPAPAGTVIAGVPSADHTRLKTGSPVVATSGASPGADGTTQHVDTVEDRSENGPDTRGAARATRRTPRSPLRRPRRASRAAAPGSTPGSAGARPPDSGRSRMSRSCSAPPRARRRRRGARAASRELQPAPAAAAARRREPPSRAAQPAIRGSGRFPPRSGRLRWQLERATRQRADDECRVGDGARDDAHRVEPLRDRLRRRTEASRSSACSRRRRRTPPAG